MFHDTKFIRLVFHSLVEKPEMMRQMPPYFDPRTMPYDQTGRFPAPRMPGPAEPMQRFPGTKP